MPPFFEAFLLAGRRADDGTSDYRQPAGAWPRGRGDGGRSTPLLGSDGGSGEGAEAEAPHVELAIESE